MSLFQKKEKALDLLSRIVMLGFKVLFCQRDHSIDIERVLKNMMFC